MSRKLERRSMWRSDEQHRRSPRICALQAWKTTNRGSQVPRRMDVEEENDDDDDDDEVGPPPSRRRGRIRKQIKLRAFEEVGITPKAGRRNANHRDHPPKSVERMDAVTKECPKHEDNATYSGRPSDIKLAAWMPDKRILELILDILQRRDTYEIFAEPVDPSEVEEYYDIIEEPMDFGTMRAKLHEGMYKDLEQFEHDVFLISRNAMYFNSSATIYFRQARAIHELAKKVFHVLKTEPENFEVKFLTTRRRSGRKRSGEATGSNIPSSSRSKTARYMDSNNRAFDISQKDTTCSSVSPYFKKHVRANPGYHGSAAWADIRDYGKFSDARDGRRSSLCETDRRWTYRLWRSYENNSTYSIYRYKPNVLVHADQGDLNYRESLMLFVKDLGPTAHKIAKQKLQGQQRDASNRQTLTPNWWLQSSKSQLPATCESAQAKPTAPSSGVPTTPISWTSLDLFSRRPAVSRDSSCRMDHVDCQTIEAHKSDNSRAFGSLSKDLGRKGDKKSPCRTFGGNVIIGDENKATEMVCLNKNNDIHLSSFGYADKSVPSLENGAGSHMPRLQKKGLAEAAKPLNLAAEHLSSNGCHNPAPNLWPPQPTESSGLDSAAQNHTLGNEKKQATLNTSRSDDNDLNEADAEASKRLLPIPAASQFILDLPYLRSCLNNQLHSSERDKLSCPGLVQSSQTSKVSFFGFDSTYQEGAYTASHHHHQPEESSQNFHNYNNLEEQRQPSSFGAQRSNLALKL